MSDITHIIIEEIKGEGSPEQAAHLSRFFKTGKGQYGEGDKFLGVKVPNTVAVVKKRWKQLSFEDLEELIRSEYHEVRMFALQALQEQYFFWSKTARRKPSKKDPGALLQSTAPQNMKRCIDFYISHTKYINNWDLVDLTCTKMLADWLLSGNALTGITVQPGRSLLYRFAKSSSLWENRIAIVTCIGFIREEQFDDAVAISEMLLTHPEDLMHKAVGWTLREMGKHDRSRLDSFLEKYAATMPRTALRYAIEHYPEEQRQGWLKRGK